MRETHLTGRGEVRVVLELPSPPEPPSPSDVLWPHVADASPLADVEIELEPPSPSMAAVRLSFRAYLVPRGDGGIFDVGTLAAAPAGRRGGIDFAEFLRLSQEEARFRRRQEAAAREAQKKAEADRDALLAMLQDLGNDLNGVVRSEERARLRAWLLGWARQCEDDADANTGPAGPMPAYRTHVACDRFAAALLRSMVSEGLADGGSFHGLLLERVRRLEDLLRDLVNASAPLGAAVTARERAVRALARPWWRGDGGEDSGISEGGGDGPG